MRCSHQEEERKSSGYLLAKSERKKKIQEISEIPDGVVEGRGDIPSLDKFSLRLFQLKWFPRQQQCGIILILFVSLWGGAYKKPCLINYIQGWGWAHSCPGAYAVGPSLCPSREATAEYPEPGPSAHWPLQAPGCSAPWVLRPGSTCCLQVSARAGAIQGMFRQTHFLKIFLYFKPVNWE